MDGLRLSGLVVALGFLIPPASSVALDPPEILYREGVSETEPLGPWLPLNGATIAGLGFIIGTRMQARPQGDTTSYRRLTMLSVPDGHPDQGSAFDPAYGCNSQSGPVGTELTLGTGAFEGPGSYSVSLAEDVPSHGATRTSCSDGPTSTATFTIDPTITLSLTAKAPVLLTGNPFAEIARITSLPTGGAGETQCARGTEVTPLSPGPTVLVRDVPRTGRWTCMARARAAVAETPDGPHYTRWSAPVSFDAITAFSSTLTIPDKKRPRYTLSYGKMPPGSEGGTVTLRISSGKGCPPVPTKTLRARVDSRLRVRFTFTLPERNKADLKRGRRGIDSYGWRFAFAFGGTAQVRAARTTSYAAVLPKRFRYGGVLLFGQPSAYCTRTT